MSDELLEELIGWLRIPSVSTGGGDPAELERAASWAIERIRAAGGAGELVRVGRGNPLAVGELRAADPAAPTVLIYGHYDVQGAGPPELWSSPAFAPEIRDGRLYARGAADDKGNFLPLLHVACAMARAGELPVHVRVLIEGEEEVGSESVSTWVRDASGPVDVAIVFDSGMPDPQTPAITVGLRGVVQLSLDVRTASRNLHSGLYGGSVLNALHVLHGLLAQVLPRADGRLREELRVGISPPSEAELASWQRLISGEQVLAHAGGLPAYAGAGEQYYLRNGADASLDVNEVHGGEPRTVVPGRAGATLTMRLAPRQDPELMRATLERLLREALPAGAQLEIGAMAAAPALFDPDQPALQLAAAALQRACGSAPAFLRSGGSIPIVAEMANRGYPVIVGGFGLPDDRIHAADESFSLQSLAFGEAAARELYLSLASLRS